VSNSYVQSTALLLLHLLRRNEKKNYHALFEKRVALHDGITEKIDSLPRNMWSAIV
jgi:hypothetical protein